MPSAGDAVAQRCSSFESVERMLGLAPGGGLDDSDISPGHHRDGRWLPQDPAYSPHGHHLDGGLLAPPPPPPPPLSSRRGGGGGGGGGDMSGFPPYPDGRRLAAAEPALVSRRAVAGDGDGVAGQSCRARLGALDRILDAENSWYGSLGGFLGAERSRPGSFERILAEVAPHPYGWPMATGFGLPGV